MQINKHTGFTLIAFIYFFINSAFLPHGLLYTFFLTPLLYYFIVKSGYKNVLGYFILPFIPLFIIHFYNGINLLFYIKSSVLYLLTYLFVFAFYAYASKHDIQKIFGRIAIVNFILTLIAILFFFTPFRDVFWLTQNLTIEIEDIPRLNLFTYEPSYYSTLLVPIVLFYGMSILTKPYPIKKIAFLLVIIIVPLILSFSLGVLSSLAFAFVVTVLFFFRTLIKKRIAFYSISIVVLSFVTAIVVLLIVYPDNLLFLRLEDLIEGKDTSGKGRTTEAIELAFQMTELRSYWFGCGPGQAKIVGEEVVRVFYNYQMDDVVTIRVPSGIADTITTFGIFGLILRLGLQVYLFFKTKVYNNYFRFALFSYIFLYQFTGSFITNIAEYVIWVLAFIPAFTDFEKSPELKKLAEE